MKATDSFTEIISAHLQERAQADPLFAKTLEKENKNIDACITYILATVKKSGRNGYTDDEVFGMAVHYYDEDNIEVPATRPNAKVVTNRAEAATSRKKGKKAASKSKVSEKQISLFA